MTATKELPTLTRLGKIKHSPYYFIYGIATRLQSPESFFSQNALGYLNIGGDSYLDTLKNDYYSNVANGVRMSLAGSNYVVLGATNHTNDLRNYPAFRPDLFNTTLLNEFEDETEFIDFVFKPKYTREFKIKVKAIRIDKSLPKIFAD